METAARRSGRTKWKWAIGLALAAAMAAALTAAGRGGHRNEDTSPYVYEDTKRLVRFVGEAARLVEERGTDAFAEFGAPGSRWREETRYIFVYSADGTCVFHPITPELVGQNLIELKDMNGKPMIERITAVARRPERDASAWEFYLWQERTGLTPIWKSSYVRKATAPDGKTYAVGCGADDLKIEPSFLKQRVDAATELLKTSGKETAFAQFRDTSAPFYFFDTYVFVVDPTGHVLVDPAFPNLKHRDLTGFRDAAGHAVLRDAMKTLEKNDSAWLQYLMPKPGATMPSRKIMYLRKVTVGEETLIVGATAFMATPIWMKL